jgi:hypothetical protein
MYSGPDYYSVASPINTFRFLKLLKETIIPKKTRRVHYIYMPEIHILSYALRKKKKDAEDADTQAPQTKEEAAANAQEIDPKGGSAHTLRLRRLLL